MQTACGEVTCRSPHYRSSDGAAVDEVEATENGILKSGMRRDGMFLRDGQPVAGKTGIAMQARLSNSQTPIAGSSRGSVKVDGLA